MRRVDVDAVVAPAALAGERCDRHQLDRGDAELAQAREVRDRGVERPLFGERADVQLVEHELVERQLRPGRRSRTRTCRRRATARGSRPAGSASTDRAAPRRRRARRGSRRPGPREGLAGEDPVPDGASACSRPCSAHGDAGRRRRPDAELGSALLERNGPEGPLPDLRRHPGHGTQPRGCQPPAGAVRRLRDDPCVLHDELMRIMTWEERHRRLVGRLLLVLILTLIVDAVGTVLVYSLRARRARRRDPHLRRRALLHHGAAPDGLLPDQEPVDGRAARSSTSCSRSGP